MMKMKMLNLKKRNKNKLKMIKKMKLKKNHMMKMLNLIVEEHVNEAGTIMTTIKKKMKKLKPMNQSNHLKNPKKQ